MNLEMVPTLITNQTNLPADFCQPHIGIVMTQNQTILCPTGQQTIGLHRALGHQVINHDPDITIAAL